MRSLFATLKSLVLPGGATTGRRIVLDGVNGLILVYDATNRLALRIGASNSLELSTADVAEILMGNVQVLTIGAGATRQFEVVLESPTPSGSAAGALMIASRSVDNTVAAFADFALGNGGDILLNGTTILRGVVGTPFRSTGNDAARAPGVASDMTTTADIVAGERYRVHVHSRVATAATAGNYAASVYQDGTQIGEILFLPNSVTRVVDAGIDFTAGASVAGSVFTVKNDAGSSGNLTFAAGAGSPRTMSVVREGFIF